MTFFARIIIVICLITQLTLCELSLVRIWQRLHWKNVAMITTESCLRRHKREYSELIKESARQSIALSVGLELGIGNEDSMFTFVCQDVEALTGLLSLRSLQPLTVLYHAEMSVSELQNELSAYNRTRSFYAANHQGLLYQVWTSRSSLQAPVMEISVEEHSETVVDLLGMPFQSIVLDWAPWAVILECGLNGKSCQVWGFLPDLIQSIGNMYNFTHAMDKQMDDYWGIIPSNGDWFDPNATFSGLFGNVVNDNYDLGLSSWQQSIERNTWVDFSSQIIAIRMVLAINLRQPKIDMGLFLRPFTGRSWVCLGLMGALFISIFAYTVILINRRGFRRSIWSLESGRVGVYVISAAFVLLNGFYSGALTMFFTAPPLFPFENEKEAMSKYPDWKIVMEKGTEIFVQPLAIAGVKEYQEFWNRLINDEDLYSQTFLERPELMRLLAANPGYVMFGATDALSDTYFAYGKDLPNFDFQAIPLSRTITNTLILSRHSPFTRLISAGIQKMRRNGALDRLDRKYIKDLNRDKSAFDAVISTKVIGLNQSGLAFVGLSLAMIFALIVLSCELAFVKRYNKRVTSSCISFRSSKDQ